MKNGKGDGCLSCWNCDHDYLENYQEQELNIISIYGENEYLCDDCWEALPEDYDTHGAI